MSEQAPADVMARLEAKFGLPSGEPETEEAVDSVSETADGEEAVEADDGLDTLEWEGQTLKVPKGLKEAVMRNEDYTRKTQAISEKERALEQAQSVTELQRREQDFLKSVESERNELYLYDQYLKQFSSMDWSKMSTEEIMRHRIEMDNAKDKRQAVADSILGKQKKFMDEIQSKISELRGKTRELASKSITGFSEETEKTIRDYAKSEGLADREIDNVLLDPRSFKILYKASQFDKVRASTGKASEAAEKVLRPGIAGRRMPAETVDKLNFGKAMNKAKTSSQKAALIEDKLARSIFKGHK